MRKTIFIIFALISVCCIASSEQKKIISKTIENNTYTYTYNMKYNYVSVWNENNKYLHEEPHYNPKAGLMPMPKTTLVNREGLKQLLHTTLKPYLKPELLLPKEDLSISFCVNLNGSIEGVIYIYPSNFNIPASAIREIEQYILKNCTVDIVYNAVLDGALYLMHHEDFILKEIYDNAIF